MAWGRPPHPASQCRRHRPASPVPPALTHRAAAAMASSSTASPWGCGVASIGSRPRVSRHCRALCLLGGRTGGDGWVGGCCWCRQAHAQRQKKEQNKQNNKPNPEPSKQAQQAQPHLPSRRQCSASDTRRGTTSVRMGIGGRYLATSCAVRPGCSVCKNHVLNVPRVYVCALCVLGYTATTPPHPPPQSMKPHAHPPVCV